MEDWRSKPRVGRHAFMRNVSEIRERLDAGETQKHIYDSLVSSGFELSYQQFNSYVRRIIKGTDNKTDVNVKKATEVASQRNEKVDTPAVVKNPADLRKLRKKSIDLEELQNIKDNDNESGNS